MIEVVRAVCNRPDFRARSGLIMEARYRKVWRIASEIEIELLERFEVRLNPQIYDAIRRTHELR